MLRSRSMDEASARSPTGRWRARASHPSSRERPPRRHCDSSVDESTAPEGPTGRRSAQREIVSPIFSHTVPPRASDGACLQRQGPDKGGRAPDPAHAPWNVSYPGLVTLVLPLADDGSDGGPEASDALTDAILGHRREAQPDDIVLRLLGHEPVARKVDDAVVGGDLAEGVDVDLLGQRHPDEEPAVRT